VQAWNKFPGVFTVLPYNQQTEIHEFYAPSRPFNTEEAIAHRYNVTHEQPSLPNRAGKSFPKLLNHAQVMAQRREYLAAHPPAPFPPSKTKSRVHGKVRAYALAKPEIDERKFAVRCWALLRTCRSSKMLEAERGRRLSYVCD
jgi:hypothetical protein